MISSLQPIAELLTLRLLDSLVEGTVICLFVAAAMRLAPRQNAATRFTLWFSALVAIAALPWISGAWPRSGIATATAHHAAITLPDSWALYVLIFWAVVSAWFALGVVRALWHLHTLRRNSNPVASAKLDPAIQATLRRHAGGTRPIMLCTSEQVRVPTAIGLFKPRILVPGWVLQELSAAELNQILLHEVAHFSRWDDWTNLAQQLVKAMFFFHPAVWWIDGKVAIEREMACDEAVLAHTGSPRAYAECLAHLAEKSLVRRGIVLAQAALGRVRQTSARIAEILNVNRPALASRSWGAAASLVAVLALGCGALFSTAPRLVGFGTSPQIFAPEAAVVSNHSVAERDVPRPPVTQAKLDAPVIQGKLNPKVLRRGASNPEHVLSLNVGARKRVEPNLIHLTGSTSAAVPFAETFWVVVEGRDASPAGPGAYRIQMWRVTVLRTVMSAPSRQIPRTET